MKNTISFFASLLLCLNISAQITYQVDKNHARLTFSATHFGISHVEGSFKDFNVTFKAKLPDFSDAVIEVTAQAVSINTDNGMRDKDLKSSKWFDALKYPVVTFKSTAFKKISDKNYKLEGTITMHGITKPLVLDVIFNGKVLNPMSKKNMLGFTITGKLDRSDFQIGTEPFASVVGKEIEITANVEFIENDSAPASR